MDSQRQKTGFLDLPAKLRNRIYFMCLMPPNGAAINMKYIEDPKRDPSTFMIIENSNANPVAVALLATSKAIRNEAGPILYGSNSFKVINYTSVAHLQTFFGSRFCLLRSLEIEHLNHSKLDLYSAFSTLRRFKVPLLQLTVPHREMENLYSPDEFACKIVYYLRVRLRASRDGSGGSTAMENFVNFAPRTETKEDKQAAAMYSKNVRQQLQPQLELLEIAPTRRLQRTPALSGGMALRSHTR